MVSSKCICCNQIVWKRLHGKCCTFRECLYRAKSSFSLTFILLLFVCFQTVTIPFSEKIVDNGEKEPERHYHNEDVHVCIYRKISNIKYSK